MENATKGTILAAEQMLHDDRFRIFVTYHERDRLIRLGPDSGVDDILNLLAQV